MAITQSAIAVSTTAVLLAAPDFQPQRVTLHNLESGTNKEVYLGNASVTVLGSVELNPDVFITLTLDPGDALYGICAGSTTIGVMIQKQD